MKSTQEPKSPIGQSMLHFKAHPNRSKTRETLSQLELAKALQRFPLASMCRRITEHGYDCHAASTCRFPPEKLRRRYHCISLSLSLTHLFRNPCLSLSRPAPHALNHLATALLRPTTTGLGSCTSCSIHLCSKRKRYMSCTWKHQLGENKNKWKKEIFDVHLLTT